MASLARRRVNLSLILKVIARSPILAIGFLPRAAAGRARSPDLPAGYEAVDLFILDWLAAEALRGGRTYLRN